MVQPDLKVKLWECMTGCDFSDLFAEEAQRSYIQLVAQRLADGMDKVRKQICQPHGTVPRPGKSMASDKVVSILMMMMMMMAVRQTRCHGSTLDLKT